MISLYNIFRLHAFQSNFQFTFNGRFKIALLCLGFVLIATFSNAQWLDWQNESSTRLVLTSVAVSDEEEKDMWPADLNNDGHTDLIVVRKEPFSAPIEPPKTNLLLINVNGVQIGRASCRERVSPRV